MFFFGNTLNPDKWRIERSILHENQRFDDVCTSFGRFFLWEAPGTVERGVVGGAPTSCPWESLAEAVNKTLLKHHPQKLLEFLRRL